MKLQPVMIEWYDAFGGDDGWEHIQTATCHGQARVMLSCGFLAPVQVKGYKTLILNYDTITENVAGHINIPNANIIKTTKLS